MNALQRRLRRPASSSPMAIREFTERPVVSRVNKLPRVRTRRRRRFWSATGARVRAHYGHAIAGPARKSWRLSIAMDCRSLSARMRRTILTASIMPAAVQRSAIAAFRAQKWRCC